MLDFDPLLPLMPHPFQGNKSFIAFSNLGDTDSLTKTWKVRRLFSHPPPYIPPPTRFAQKSLASSNKASA
jgi:hypothetical protein